MNRFYVVIAIIMLTVFALFTVSCSRNEHVTDLIVFYAPCFAPIIDALRKPIEAEISVNLRHEASGSQVVCRKVVELGRECDVMLLADNGLFKKIASSHCSWRIDFANDEIVLGVGTRARLVDEAEQNWMPVLLNPDTRLVRVDENLGPTGYRTLLVWKLRELHGGVPGLTDSLLANTDTVVEHVVQLATMLKSGDADYGFLYKTTCIKYDIRFIPLPDSINLGSADTDYSLAEVNFSALKSGAPETITVKGAPITYGLSVPHNAPNKETAYMFIKTILSRKDVFDKYGFNLFTPKFYGSRSDYEHIREFIWPKKETSAGSPAAHYAGEF